MNENLGIGNDVPMHPFIAKDDLGREVVTINSNYNDLKKKDKASILIELGRWIEEEIQKL